MTRKGMSPTSRSLVPTDIGEGEAREPTERELLSVRMKQGHRQKQPIETTMNQNKGPGPQAVASVLGRTTYRKTITIVLLVSASLLYGCVGTMLPGRMYALPTGRTLQFSIQTSYGNGTMEAYDPQMPLPKVSWPATKGQRFVSTSR